VLTYNKSGHMSSNLWDLFLRDDVETFQRSLAGASYTSGGGASSFKSGSPGALIYSSLGASPKAKKLTGTSPGTPLPERGSGGRFSKTLARDELNARDHLGRTLLHHVASSQSPTAAGFALALLEVPYLDIYAQDWESGWTALHRALYAGNATIALALMTKDVRDATDLSKPGASNHPSGSLIKIKDREGYSPFDVYAATITSRDIKRIASPPTSRDPLLLDVDISDVSSSGSINGDDLSIGEDGLISRASLKPRFNLFGDEVYTFGSNKNLNLGVGDQDDRQYPERITLKRPAHLLQRFFREYQEERSEDFVSEPAQESFLNQDLPALIKSKPIKIQDIVMSKLHTAILTTDPESNLFMCGFGPGGRLGTGDEATKFSFVCIENGGLANKKVLSVALGQDHTLAITANGEIFSWGSNKSGQLGYNLPRTNSRDDVPMQKSPRQIFNPLKKEIILGAAASAIHSVVFSNSGLYTFGKNEGQLGLVDSDARSLEVQTTPRRVGASLFSAAIHSVSAIDQATAILLQNHEVWVFSHYGYSRLSFPLEVSSRFIRDSFMATRYDLSTNHIVKITSGGNTICALSSSGEVFTAQVNKLEHQPTLTSTTNPAKIRNSLSSPVRVWSIKKAHMAVKDVDVGQDGSIIICTASGSAWRKEKRGKTKDGPSKDYKFARIPGLSRVVGVCSNAFGAFAVAQRDCDVTREQINVEETTLWKDILPLSPFNSLRSTMGSTDSDHATLAGTWHPEPAMAIKQAILGPSNVESYFQPTLADPPAGTIWAMTTLSDIRIPIHEFVLTGRSSVLRKMFHDFRRKHYLSAPELLTIEHDQNGQRQIIFQGLDIFTILNIVFFLYTDNVLDVWQQARQSPMNASRFRQVRTEVMRISTLLNLQALERAARLMIEPSKDMKSDFMRAITDPTFFESGDVIIDLNDEHMIAHSQIICQRCPFFNALFYGRSGGRWLESRRKNPQDKIHIDLKHIDRQVFEFVLRYIYADTDDQLFDEVRTKDHEDFIDLVLDVAFVANELMIDRLAQICQKVLGTFVNSRNVCYLLNSIAPCSVTEFKDASVLGDLDDYLLCALDSICHDNQLATFPISRGRNTDEYLFEKYPELVSLIETDKRRRVDSMRLRSRLNHSEDYDGKLRTMNNNNNNNEKTVASPLVSKSKMGPAKDSPAALYGSPPLKSQRSTGDLMFQMDDEHLLSPGEFLKGKAAVRGPKTADANDISGLGSSLQDGGSFGNQSYLDRQMASPHTTSLAESPSELRTATLQRKQNGSLSPQNASQAPWTASVISNSRKNLMDIMKETSESRVSNLSLGMSARRESSNTFTAKLSQKERKKMQQQQMQEEQATAQQKAKEAPQNPWKITTPSKPAPLQQASGQEALSPTPSKPAQRAGMTLRQTVAGTPPPRPEPPATPMQIKGRSVSVTTQPPPRPSLSGPSTVARSTSPSPSSNAVPTIQSIRHIPRSEPYQTSFHADSPNSMSLATILMQQQTEKDELREAATAKHNLQDIQLEQEFQEWWDKESRRVQGLPELGPTPNQEERDGRAGRGAPGKGSGQRKRRGKGGVSASAQQTPRNDSGPAPKDNPTTFGREQQQQQQQQQQLQAPKGHHTNSAAGSSRRGGRGGHRGRERGREKPINT
ncbi:hypothetical protein AOCH_006595, partial [Aspergillus ochraceoroseus]